MAITASMVKELRELTGAGMMDCKKALNETNGNMEEAIEFLRKNGEAKAVKKAGRIAAEGIVMAEVRDSSATDCAVLPARTFVISFSFSSGVHGCCFPCFRTWGPFAFSARAHRRIMT